MVNWDHVTGCEDLIMTFVGCYFSGIEIVDFTLEDHLFEYLFDGTNQLVQSSNCF